MGIHKICIIRIQISNLQYIYQVPSQVWFYKKTVKIVKVGNIDVVSMIINAYVTMWK